MIITKDNIYLENDWYDGPYTDICLKSTREILTTVEEHMYNIEDLEGYFVDCINFITYEYQEPVYTNIWYE